MPLPPEIVYLRLVPPAPATCLPDLPPIQISYHPDSTPSPGPHQLVFLKTQALNGHAFNDLLNTIRPSFVIDLRVVPRFDFVGTSRPQAFRLFDALQTQYLDITGLLGIESRQDARLNPGLLIHEINDQLSAHPLTTGPLVFLFDDEDHCRLAINIFPHALPIASLSPIWKVYYS